MENVPMFSLCHSARSKMCENVLKSVLPEFGGTVSPAGANQTGCDFVYHATQTSKVKLWLKKLENRCVCKTSFMQKNEINDCWEVKFDCIYKDFDALFLVVVTTGGLHLFKHNGKAGLSAPDEKGEQTLEYTGSDEAGYNDMIKSEEHIFKKMVHVDGCLHLVFVAFSDGDADAINRMGVQKAVDEGFLG